MAILRQSSLSQKLRFLSIFILILAGASTLDRGLIGVAQAQEQDGGSVAGVQEYFIPGTQAQMLNMFNDLLQYTSANVDEAYVSDDDGDRITTSRWNWQDYIEVRVSIVAYSDASTVLIDKASNGYVDPGNYSAAAYDAVYTLDKGDSLVLDHLGSDALVGGDRIVSIGGPIFVVRATWPTYITLENNHNESVFGGQVLAGYWELYPTAAWGTSYGSPMGEDGSSYAGHVDDDSTKIVVQSKENNTVVNLPGGGTVTLDRGQSYVINGIDVGDLVTANKSFSASLVASGHENVDMRFFNLTPPQLLDDEYIIPLTSMRWGSGDNSRYNRVRLYIYAYDNTSYTVYRGNNTIASGSLGAGNSTVVYVEDTTSYAEDSTLNNRLRVTASDGTRLQVLVAMNTDEDDWDWGFPVVGSRHLVDEYYLAWSPATGPNYPTSGNSGYKDLGHPVYITPVEDNTTIRVDWDNNGTTDKTVNLDRGEWIALRDTSDRDNTGAHLTGSGPFALAWGEDILADTADGYDLGYTILPQPSTFFDPPLLQLDKEVGPDEVPPGGFFDVTLVLKGNLFDIHNVAITDTLPTADFVYRANSAIVHYPGGPNLPMEPVVMGQNLYWDLKNPANATQDYTLPANQSVTVTFRVDVASPYAAPLPDTQVNNASGYGEWNDFKFHPTDFDYMQVGAFPQLDIVKTSDPSGAVKLGDTLDYQIVVENTGAVAQTGLVLTDTLPTGVTYIAQSTIATGPAGSEKRVRDEFSTRSYSRNDGPDNWKTDWIEQNDSNGANGGQIYIDPLLNVLGLHNHNRSNPAPRIHRAVDLSGGYTQATLRFDWGVVGDLESDDAVVVEISTGGSYTVLETFAGFTGTTTGSRAYDISSYLSADTRVRFRIADGFQGIDEYFGVDNVEIQATGPGQATKDNNPSNGVPDLANGTPPILITAGDGFSLEPGQKMTVTFQVKVNDSLDPNITELVNTAWVRSNEIPNAIKDDVVNPVSVEPAVIELDKQASKATVQVGEEITYTIRITNTGSVTVTELPLQDFYETQHLDFVSSTPPAVDNLDDGILDWADLTASFGQHLAPGQSFVVTLRFQAVDTTRRSASLMETHQPSDAREGELGAAGTRAMLWIIEAWPDADCDGWSVEFDGTHYKAETWRVKVDGTIIDQGTTKGNETVSGDWPGWVDLTQAHTFMVQIYEGGWLSRSTSFGNCPVTGSIGNRVFEDLDSSGLPDGGVEPGLNGVTVRLYENACPAAGAALRTTVTAGNGDYLFASLNAGTYCVDVDDATLPAGVVLTTANEPLTVNLASGQNFVTADFGYHIPAASIGDRVYYDVNGDGGADDDGEPGLNGIEVNLYQGNCPASGAPFMTQVTAGNGNYLFTNLPAGDYCVDVNESTLLGGVSLTTGNEPHIVNLGPNASYLLADFGYRGLCPDGTVDLAVVKGAMDQFDHSVQDTYDDACVVIEPPTGSIGDFVWWDINNNGLQDAGEPGIPDVPLALAGPSGPQSATTDSSGTYTFSNLNAGSYSIAIDQSSFLISTPWVASPSDVNNNLSDTVDSDAGSDHTIQDIVLDPGETDLTNDFGFWIRSAITITKQLNSYEPIPTAAGFDDNVISFTIRITNTGDTYIKRLPLTDTYNARYMTFDSSGANDPAPDQVNEVTESTSTLVWDDLNQGGYLAPGDAVSVSVYFRARRDTGDLTTGEAPCHVAAKTCNTATVSGATADPDGPDTTFTAAQTLDDVKDWAPVQILSATAVPLADQAVTVAGATIRVHWQTLDESNIWGFELYRIRQKERTLMATMLAEKSGQPTGATYAFDDTAVEKGERYTYLIEIVDLNGSRHESILGSVLNGAQIFLPIIDTRSEISNREVLPTEMSDPIFLPNISKR